MSSFRERCRMDVVNDTAVRSLRVFGLPLGSGAQALQHDRETESEFRVGRDAGRPRVGGEP